MLYSSLNACVSVLWSSKELFRPSIEMVMSSLVLSPLILQFVAFDESSSLVEILFFHPFCDLLHLQ